MSDYKWQKMCLESWLQHPEYYAKDEDVDATIERLRAWLRDYEEKYLKPKGAA